MQFSACLQDLSHRIALDRIADRNLATVSLRLVPRTRVRRERRRRAALAGRVFVLQVGQLVEGARALHGGHTLTTAWLSAGSGLLLLPLLVLPAHRKAAAAEGWTGAVAPRLRGGELSPAAYALVRRLAWPVAPTQPLWSRSVRMAG
jgi:hypothetical protein